MTAVFKGDSFKTRPSGIASHNSATPVRNDEYAIIRVHGSGIKNLFKIIFGFELY